MKIKLGKSPLFVYENYRDLPEFKHLFLQAVDLRDSEFTPSELFAAMTELNTRGASQENIKKQMDLFISVLRYEEDENGNLKQVIKMISPSSEDAQYTFEEKLEAFKGHLVFEKALRIGDQIETGVGWGTVVSVKEDWIGLSFSWKDENDPFPKSSISEWNIENLILNHIPREQIPFQEEICTNKVQFGDVILWEEGGKEFYGHVVTPPIESTVCLHDFNGTIQFKDFTGFKLYRLIRPEPVNINILKGKFKK